jgi:hypothetical protein
VELERDDLALARRRPGLVLGLHDEPGNAATAAQLIERGVARYPGDHTLTTTQRAIRHTPVS